VFGYDPEDGRCFVYSDYSQLELRGITAITGEKAMEVLYRAGQDLHDYTAEMLFGKDFTKTDRQIAKTCNFNLLYGGSAGVLGTILLKQTGIILPHFKLEQLARRWKSLYKTIAEWQEKGVRNWRAGRLGSTPFGRRYLGKLMTDQLNIENQGFGAEVAKLAMHYMKPKLDELEDVKLVNFIHDSYILDCPTDPAVYEPAASIVANCMQEAWFEATKSVAVKDLPMPVNAYVGYNWGAIEAGDYFYDYALEGLEHASL
jgi:DNA polymerase-1